MLTGEQFVAALRMFRETLTQCASAIRDVQEIISPLIEGEQTARSPIGQSLLQARATREWSQKQAAGFFGVEPNTYARWERDARVPGERFRSKVMEFISVVRIATQPASPTPPDTAEPTPEEEEPTYTRKTKYDVTTRDIGE